MSGDHFSAQADTYAQYRPGYPAELFDWLAAQCPARALAWDCGTGNGQAALALAAHFDAVAATDLSAAQIAHARAHPRVRYATATAQASGLGDASCDLITVAQALHWFCEQSFYAEATRVLKPGGLLAAWTYTLLRGEEAVNAVIARYYTEIIGPWWPPERRWVDLAYAGMPFPFPTIAAPAFAIRLQWTLADLLGYLRSWSATQRCQEATGSDPLAETAAQLAALWGNVEARKSFVWPLALVCGRKP